MKKSSSILSAVLLLCAATGYASQSRAPYASQFHVKHQPKQTPASARKSAVSKTPATLNQPSAGTAKAQSKAFRFANSQTSTSPTSLGLVSAKQIPAGGYNDGTPGYLGDFNGDGKMDVVSNVETNSTDAIAVVLSNGNGTFQAPVLTTTNGFYPMVVGDLNGDGKDDVVQIYPGSPSTATVWLSNGDGTFKQGNTYQISPAGLEGGVLTDVNGDGKLDILAVDAQTPSLVRTLLGNGDGTFQPATSVTLATSAPSYLIFADFNGDGKVDFAGLDNNQQVNVYLQEGGNFVLNGAPLINPDSSYDVCGLAAGDLMGNGKPEIVTVNCDGADEDTVTVYVNNGDGSFATGVYYDVTASSGSSPANNYAYSATVADVNGDGKADILVSTGYGGDIAVLLSNGDGTVKVPNVAYATGGEPYVAPLVADFNGDGLADILQPDYFYSYAYLQGYGDGTFRAALDYYGPITSDNWPYSYSIATADFNGDGIPDFVVGADGDYQQGITVFLSRGDGSLKPGVNYGSSSYLYNVAIADFNGDGKPDIVAADFYNDVVQIFTGNGDGTFNAGPTYATDSSYPWQVVTGDFNHDGHPDVAVSNWDSESVSVFLNDGSGGLGAVTTYALSNYAYGIAAGDINGDGYLDLLVPLYWDGDSRVAVLMGKNDNSGTFQAETDISLVNGSTTYYEPLFITLADFNGDGKLDFAVSVDGDDGPAQGLVVALGNGDGTFGTPNLYSTTSQDFTVVGDGPYPRYVQAADINGDGIPDLVYTNEEYGTVGVLLGNGDGTFGLPSEYPAGTFAYALAIADVNGDGALDVVTANSYSAAVTVLLNANGSIEKPDFGITASATSASVKAGSSASYDLTLTGKNAYESAITLTCSGLPAKAKCSFSPAKVTTAGNLPQATVLTISTTAATTTTAALVPASSPDSNMNSGGGLLLASLPGIGLFGLVIGVGTKKQKYGRRLLAVLPATVLLAAMFTLVGCSGVSTPATTTPIKTTVAGTPAGTYTVKVTATGSGSHAPAHSMNLTLVVQ